MHASSRERAEALARGPRESQTNRSGRKSGVTDPLGDGTRDPGADREMMIVDRIVAGERQTALEIRLQLGKDLLVERHQARPVVPLHRPIQ